MSKFNVGDKIVPVYLKNTKFEVYTFKGYMQNDQYLCLEEHPLYCFDAGWFKLVEQPEQDCPYSIIEELSAQVDNLEQLVIEQAAQIRELQSVSQAQQAECYLRLNRLLTSHRSFQESTECRSNELAASIVLRFTLW